MNKLFMPRNGNISTFDHLKRLQVIIRLIKQEKCIAAGIAESTKYGLRTIKRDIDLLRKGFNAPLVYDRKLKAYKFTAEWKLADALEEI